MITFAGTVFHVESNYSLLSLPLRMKFFEFFIEQVY